MIVHKEKEVIVQRITDHEVENGDIALNSLNSVYEYRILSLKEVDKIFKVVKVIR